MSTSGPFGAQNGSTSPNFLKRKLKTSFHQHESKIEDSLRVFPVTVVDSGDIGGSNIRFETRSQARSGWWRAEPRESPAEWFRHKWNFLVSWQETRKQIVSNQKEVAVERKEGKTKKDRWKNEKKNRDGITEMMKTRPDAHKVLLVGVTHGSSDGRTDGRAYPLIESLRRD